MLWRADWRGIVSKCSERRHDGTVYRRQQGKPMSGFFFALAAVIPVLGILIVVHEYGHYQVARWFGVKVLRFSFGFGRPLLAWRHGRDDTEWAIGAFPIGGYVKMLDEREGEVAAHEQHRSFNRQTVYVRMAIVAAGPLANLLLAVLLYWGVFLYGSQELKPLLGTPPAASAAAAAGVVNGELVRSVGGEPVMTFDDFRWILLRRAADENSVDFEVINLNREITTRRLDLGAIRESGWEGDVLRLLGLTLYRPAIRPLVDKITPGSAAEQGGLHSGDEIVALDDETITSWHEMTERVRRSPGKKLDFAVRREGALLHLSITPLLVEEQGHHFGRIGASVARPSPETFIEMTTLVSYDPWAALRKAVVETWDKSIFSFVMIGKMISGEVSLRNISGPVTIADYAGQSARLGLDYYIKLMALISISIGVMNLLPVPILDGGHLLYYVLEIVRRGPLSERSMEIGQQIGLALLFMLMAFAVYNDIHRLISG